MDSRLEILNQYLILDLAKMVMNIVLELERIDMIKRRYHFYGVRKNGNSVVYIIFSHKYKIRETEAIIKDRASNNYPGVFYDWIRKIGIDNVNIQNSNYGSFRETYTLDKARERKKCLVKHENKRDKEHALLCIEDEDYRWQSKKKYKEEIKSINNHKFIDYDGLID